MNFLLHFAFARRDHADRSDQDARVVGVGAMLPDFWKMADRRARPTVDEGAPVDGDPRVALLSLGIDHHVVADRWFHRTPWFNEGEKRLRRRFFQAEIPKLLLFAHPAWEMCLDGALLRARGAPFRADLAAALTDAAPHLSDVSLARATHADELGPAFFERVARIAAAGRTGDLFDDYLGAAGIAWRVGRMRRAFGLSEPTPAEEERIAAALRPSEDEAPAAIEALFAEPAPVPTAQA